MEISNQMQEICNKHAKTLTKKLDDLIIERLKEMGEEVTYHLILTRITVVRREGEKWINLYLDKEKRIISYNIKTPDGVSCWLDSKKQFELRTEIEYY